MAKPFFSIVIPTRGRTHVVGWAIRSALAQTFTDLECVVIDNNVDDRVETICAQFDDPRLRRVKTGNLNMPDNLERAYLSAQGEYVILIEDRQCLYHHTLEFVHRLAQREELDCLVWSNDVFEDGIVPARIRRFGGDRSLRKVRSDDVLDGFCGNQPGQDPFQFIAAHRCAVRVGLLDKIRADTGLAICEPVSPDNTAGLKVMNALEKYHYFNGSFAVSHSDHMSNGSTFHRNKNSADEFWRSIGGREQAYQYTPIKACFNENTSFNDYLRLAARLGGRLQAHPVEPVFYYTRLGEALLKASEDGFDRKEELAAWRAALACELPPVRNEVEENLGKRSRRRLLQSLRVRLGIRALERLIRPKKTPRTRYEETTANVPEFIAAESLVLARRDFPAREPATVRS